MKAVSTDTEMLERLLVELKKFILSYRVAWTGEFLTGGIRDFAINHLKGKDAEVAFRIIKQLCSEGWEPFTHSSFGNEHVSMELRPIA